MAFCSKCGKELKEKDLFCSSCGNDLRKTIKKPTKEQEPEKQDTLSGVQKIFFEKREQEKQDTPSTIWNVIKAIAFWIAIPILIIGCIGWFSNIAKCSSTDYIFTYEICRSEGKQFLTAIVIAIVIFSVIFISWVYRIGSKILSKKE